MLHGASFAGLSTGDLQQPQLFETLDGAVHAKHRQLEFTGGGFDGGFAPKKRGDPSGFFGVGQQTGGGFRLNRLPGALGRAALVGWLH